MSFKMASERLSMTRKLSKDLAYNSFRTADIYSKDVQPKTYIGGVFTVAAFSATIAYAIFLIIEFSQHPLTVTNNLLVMQRPQPMNLTCLALSGCLVSNTYTPAYDFGVQVPDSAKGCISMNYNETLLLNVTWSQYRYDGLSVLYDPTTTSSNKVPNSYGAIVHSQAACWPENPPVCAQGVFQMYCPLGMGLASARLVNTINTTRTDAGALRYEWFLTYQSTSNVSTPKATPCWSQAPYGKYVQALLRSDTMWNQIQVSDTLTWTGLVGMFGGALTLFLQIGATTLITAALCIKYWGFWNHWRSPPALRSYSIHIPLGSGSPTANATGCGTSSDGSTQCPCPASIDGTYAKVFPASLNGMVSNNGGCAPSSRRPTLNGGLETELLNWQLAPTRGSHLEARPSISQINASPNQSASSVVLEPRLRSSRSERTSSRSAVPDLQVDVAYVPPVAESSPRFPSRFSGTRPPPVKRNSWIEK